jgi:hypothetical protein
MQERLAEDQVSQRQLFVAASENFANCRLRSERRQKVTARQSCSSASRYRQDDAETWHS